MDQFISQAMDWLHPYVGKDVEIVKEEDGDQDHIRLRLERVSLGENRYEDPDNYVAKQALLLYGDGVVIENEQRARLPQSVYEIPITEEMRIIQGVNALTFASERAQYRISTDQKSVN